MGIRLILIYDDDTTYEQVAEYAANALVDLSCIDYEIELDDEDEEDK